jgi:hypothetical protein
MRARYPNIYVESPALQEGRWSRTSFSGSPLASVLRQLPLLPLAAVEPGWSAVASRPVDHEKVLRNAARRMAGEPGR